jgi:hypothetical protein
MTIPRRARLAVAVGALFAFSAWSSDVRFASRPLAVWSTPEAAVYPEVSAPRGRTIPHFADTYTADGAVYPYQMVGTDPRRSHRRTVVRTVIVPIRFVFADGTTFDPHDVTPQLRGSPLFQKSTFGADMTQYGDAVQRAEFWSSAGNTRWHVLLGHPSMKRTAVVRVPADTGGTQQTSRGGTVGVVDERYFSERVVPTLVSRLHLPPTKLLVFWSSGVVFVTPGASGVILGEHSAGRDSAATAIWTWVWSSWQTSAAFPDPETDIAALSHEIAEWYNNPFGVNRAPAWQAQFYPCNDALEVGDPLVGATVVKDGFHLQDEAFLAWFAHEVPSTALGGAYSFFGTLTTPASGCGDATS